MSNVMERVCNVVSQQLNVKVEDLKPSNSFTEDLGADSLDTVELVMALEEEFDVEISDDDAERILTIQEAVDHLNEKLV